MTKSYGWKNVIYSSYNTLPKEIQSFDNQEWVEKQINRLNNIKEELETIKSRNTLLIDCVNQHDNNSISILDYGGGIGLTYFSLVASTDKMINYNIVELPSICNSGKDLPINFYEAIPEIEVDIVYIRTALQYSQDWRKTLSDLMKCNPKYIVLSHLSAGNIPTYLTLQMWGDYLIPYWFLNKKELDDHILEMNYNKISDHTSYDMTEDYGWKTYKHFPEHLRLEKLVDIVYARDEA